jgi:double stranded RNA-specific editase B
MEVVTTGVSRTWSSTKMSSKHDDGPPKKKRKKNTKPVAVGQENPVMILNEIKPNIVYDIAESGLPHARIYAASVTLNGKTYSAEDRTKKKAKAKVAQMILLCSVQLKDPSFKPPLMEEITGEAEDFSKDLLEVVCSSEEFYSFETAAFDKVKALPMASVSNAEQSKSNPVFYLNHLKPGIKIEIVKEEGSPHSLIYTARGN